MCACCVQARSVACIGMHVRTCVCLRACNGDQQVAGGRFSGRAACAQVTEVPLDLHHPHNPSVVTGTLIVSLEWIPINAAPPPPYPSPGLALLINTGRGDLFVRIIRALDLPPADPLGITCDATVKLRAAGQSFQSKLVQSLCPVWHEENDPQASVFRFEHASELAELHIAVEHNADSQENTDKVLPHSYGCARSERVLFESRYCSRKLHVVLLVLLPLYPMPGKCGAVSSVHGLSGATLRSPLPACSRKAKA